MRDPARIPRILAKLEKVWAMSPDWRLGQLISNITHSSADPFFQEDDALETMLDSELKRRKIK